MIIPRGEAVRSFLYSDTLRVLSENATVTLLSVIDDEGFKAQFSPYTQAVYPLREYPENTLVRRFRTIVHNAHFQWLGSGVARNRIEMHDAQMRTIRQKTLRKAWKAFIWTLGNRPTVEALGRIERALTLRMRPTQEFDRLFDELRPELVFNTSHVHGNASSLPVRVAYHKGIKTAGFVFSWDNLTSRSRIMEPYHHYLVWTKSIKNDFLRIYPNIEPDRVHITGTPQFDFHFRDSYWLSREELAKRVGFDPKRPFVLYTTGIDRHFPEEHRTVQLVIDLLRKMPQKPQLVVRNYIKGISNEMRALTKSGHDNVYFPPMEWDEKWFIPTQEDQRILTSMLRECALGINAASTISLELMLHRKPVINLGFDPPGSNLPNHLRYKRHTDEFDHYIPVTRSGGVMIARSPQDMAEMIQYGLNSADRFDDVQAQFLQNMFGNRLDGCAGTRVAETLLSLAKI